MYHKSCGVSVSVCTRPLIIAVISSFCGLFMFPHAQEKSRVLAGTTISASVALDADVKEIVVPTLRRAHSDRCALELLDYPLYESFNEIILKPFLLFRRPKPASGTARDPA